MKEAEQLLHPSAVTERREDGEEEEDTSQHSSVQEECSISTVTWQGGLTPACNPPLELL